MKQTIATCDYCSSPLGNCEMHPNNPFFSFTPREHGGLSIALKAGNGNAARSRDFCNESCLRDFLNANIETTSRPTAFTYEMQKLDEWLVRDPQGGAACRFPTEGEAVSAVRRWNAHNGSAVTVSWKSPPEGADEDNRGTYTVKLDGTSFSRAFSGGWHSDFLAYTLATKLRNLIADFGLEKATAIATTL